MSEQPPLQQYTQTSSGDVITPQKRRVVRRIGCALLLAGWFVILLTPCALFYLAANGEIRLDHRDIPQPHAHPRLLISLISEQDDRGLRIERSSPTRILGDTSICIETAVAFFLWESSGGNQDVRFCDCYQRFDADASWTLQSTLTESCSGTE